MSAALNRAVYDGYTDLVRLLLDHGADVNRGNYYKDCPRLLCLAIRCDQPTKEAMVRLLVGRGATVEPSCDQPPPLGDESRMLDYRYWGMHRLRISQV